MDTIIKEVSNSVESVTDNVCAKKTSVTDPSKTVKKNKSNIKECKVLYWNKYSTNFAFEYNNKPIQITLSSPLKNCGKTVKIGFENGSYELIER